MNSTESTTCGYRTNRAAQVRMEEIRRKLSEQPKQSTAKPKHSHVQHSSEPLNRYLHMKKPTREKKLEGLDSTDDFKWMVRAQEVLKNRGSPTGSEKRAYDQAEELARLQRAVQSKKILKEKLDRISSEIAALTGVLKDRGDSSSEASIEEDK
ncbi:uncharacterized protein LOC106666259 isoform X1 [Cimex lectularius]|uniref:Uncharacterized protein n=1 Tax=Cimex lectularius TaxID=79782 RepID=A0A8I6TE73_CIMLE|nr:uncharacterized protein LOC106666259 isoform X1 [Cimex lectularius]XP_014248815.1 uncharacterized protein LOC106666259 isoform X1 [Cimex lectularius]